MKDAPFQITTTLMIVLFITVVAGGILGTVLPSFGLVGFWGVFLAAFLPVPLGSAVRRMAARSAAEQAGVTGESPVAFSLPLRLAIGAAAAIGVAFLFTFSDFYSLGFVLGAVASLLVQLVLILVFYFAVAARS